MKNLILLILFFIITVGGNAQEEIITFPSDELFLNGTFSIPEGDGPFPVAILVHGSGPSDRDQSVTFSDANSACLYPGLYNQSIANFYDIATYLSANGIAVFRYDKRSLTHGASLDPVTVSTKDFVTDIESAIRYVQTRTDVDTACIVLAGHSQGSTLIPIAANNSKAVAGLISLAGPVTAVDSLLPEQYRAIYLRCANDAFSGAAVANQFYQQFRQMREETFPEGAQLAVNFPGNPTNPVPFGYETFWKDWIDMGDNVLNNYNAANLPTLIIQGDDDFNVPASDALRFQAALPSSLTTVALFEGINHFLTPANTPNVAPAILETIANWIKNTKPTATAVQETPSLEGIEVLQRQDYIKVRFLNVIHPFEQLLVSDLSGRILKQFQVGNQMEYEFSVNRGLNFLSFYTNKGIVTKKFFVE